MYQCVNKHVFIEAFRTMGRYDRQDGNGGNFTYEALLALFEYLENVDAGIHAPEDNHPGMQLDVIALCCDFAEYDDPMEALFEYCGREAVEGDEAKREQSMDWLRDQTTVIEIPGTDRIIIQQF